MTAEQIIQKLREIIPNDVLDMWYELPNDIDYMVAHDFIRDVLKDALIKTYKEIGSRYPEVEPLDELVIMSNYRDLIIEGLGMIEIYLSEFKGDV